MHSTITSSILLVVAAWLNRSDCELGVLEPRIAIVLESLEVEENKVRCDDSSLCDVILWPTVCDVTTDPDNPECEVLTALALPDDTNSHDRSDCIAAVKAGTALQQLPSRCLLWTVTPSSKEAMRRFDTAYRYYLSIQDQESAWAGGPNDDLINSRALSLVDVSPSARKLVLSSPCDRDMTGGHGVPICASVNASFAIFPIVNDKIWKPPRKT